MAQPIVNPGGGPGDSGGAVALPGQWLSRLTQPDKLDLSVDRGASFRAWKTRWKDFCTLSGLTSQPTAVQLAMMRSCLSDDTIRVVENMGLSQEESADMNVILERLERHAVGQVSQVMQRRAFNLRRQEVGETFDDYVTCLRELSKDCGFCDNCRDSYIRDRIVIGIRDADVIRRLCAVPDLSLEKAITLCRSEECAARDTSEITDGEAGPGVAVAWRGREARSAPGAAWRPAPGAGRGRRATGDVTDHCGLGSRPAPAEQRWPPPSRGQSTGDPWSRDRPADVCRRCGRARCRGETACPAYDSDCFCCGDYGHWGRVCSRRPRRDRVQADAVVFESTDDRAQLNMVDVNSAQYRSAPTIEVDVFGTRQGKVCALPDTGADISLAGPGFAETFGWGRVEPPTVHPRVVDGRYSNAVGQVDVKIKLGKIEVCDTIHIIPGVTRLVLSWHTTLRLGLIPDDYPKQKTSALGRNHSEDIAVKRVAASTGDHDGAQWARVSATSAAQEARASVPSAAQWARASAPSAAQDARASAPSAAQETWASAPSVAHEARASPSRPFEQLCTDLCQHVGHYFMVAVDPFSGWQFVRHAFRVGVYSPGIAVFCVSVTPTLSLPSPVSAGQY